MTSPNPFDILNTRSDDVEVFKVSLTDINARDNGDTLLLRAAGVDCWKIAKFLLEAKADASGTGSRGWTALHHVAHAGPVELIKPLIEAKCGIDNQTGLGSTALMFAAQRESEAVCELLDAKANVVTAQRELEVVRVLLEAKANTMLKMKYGCTVLDQTAAGSECSNLILLAGLSAPPEAPPAPLPSNLAFIA